MLAHFGWWVESEKKQEIPLQIRLKKMVTEGVEPSTVALLAQRSNRLSYATFLLASNPN